MRRTELCLDAMVYVGVWVGGWGCMARRWVGGGSATNCRCVCVFVCIVCLRVVCVCLCVYG